MSDLYDEKNGLKTVLQELHDPAAPVPGAAPAEQLALLALPLDRAETKEAEQRGRGRPRGAKNKNTEAWREYILAGHSSPLEVLAQTTSMSLQELGDRIAEACGWQRPYVLTWEKALELLKLQLQAAKELAPYLHQKMPLALEAGDKGLIQLVVQANATVQQAAPAQRPQLIQVLDVEPEQNQLVTPPQTEISNSGQSNSESEGADNAEESSHD